MFFMEVLYPTKGTRKSGEPHQAEGRGPERGPVAPDVREGDQGKQEYGRLRVAASARRAATERMTGRSERGERKSQHLAIHEHKGACLDAGNWH
jgi:hypothetical protein